MSDEKKNDEKEQGVAGSAEADAPKADAPKADAPKADAPKPAPKAAPAAKATPAAAGAAAKPKKAPPPPDPRVEEAKATAERLKAAVTAVLGEAAVEEAGNAHFNPMILVNRKYWLKVVELLGTHDDWKLNYVEMMAGTDYPDYIEVVAYVQSTELGHFVCLKTRTPRDNAEVPSMVSLHPGVDWEEREIYDLLGVTFTNHPDLRRIMMWEGFHGHPLRKDYTPWEGKEDPDVAD